MYTKEQQQKGADLGAFGDPHNHHVQRPPNGGINLMEDERDPDVIPAQFGRVDQKYPGNVLF